jgi:hypothetical protein
MISRRQVADLNQNIKAFKKKNTQLVVIGNGPEHYITPFRDATGYRGPLFTDPSLETYKILDFKKGLGSVLGLSPLKAGIRALSTGYLQKGIQGPPLQQGGVLVVGPGHIAHYLHRSRKAGDHPSVAELLRACAV